MADNVVLNAGSGGDTVAADDVGGVKYQLVQLVTGSDGGSKTLVTGTAGVPVNLHIGTTVLVGGAGAVAAGVLRTTLASDDPAVASLQTIDDIVLVEDAAHSSGDKGVMALAVRNDANSSLVSADGDYASLKVNSLGELYVHDQHIEDVTFAEDTGHSTGDIGIMVLAVRRDAAAVGSSADGDYSTLNVDASGRLWCNVGNTVSVSDGGSSITVDNGGTFAVQESGGALTALQLIDDIVLSEDAAHSSGDKGVMALVVRKDSGAAIAGTDGDYSPLQVDSSGNLRVNVVAGGGTGGTSATDDAAFTAASGSGTPIMGFVTSDSVDSGDVGVIGMLANRQLKVTLYDSGGVELSVGGGTQYDEDTAHSSGDKLTLAGAVRRDSPTSGTSADGDRATINVDSNGRLYVACDSHAVTQSGTWNIATVTTVSTVAAIGTSVTPGTSAGHLGKAEDAAHSTGDTGVFVLAVRSDTAAQTADTNGDYCGLICDSSGRLHVNVGNTVTVGSHAVTNAGTFAVQVDGSALAALQLIDDPVFSDDAAFTAGTSKVYAMGFFADDTSTDSVDEGDVGIARMTLDRCIRIVPTAQTSGGHTISRTISAASTNATSVKGSAGQVYGWYLSNTNTSARYLKLYNKATAPTVGTDTPVLTICIPGSGGANVEFTHGIAFGTGIALALTTGAADSDTGAVAANEIIVNLFYK
jgi:hypothetical protein